MLNRWFIMIALGWFTSTSLASTVDLGDLHVASGAGERLDGRIALIGAEGLRRRDITVTLGSKEDFGNLGLERFAYLDTLRSKWSRPMFGFRAAHPSPMPTSTSSCA